jgi:hypothetical protein
MHDPPTGVSMTSIADCGMECVTGTVVTVNGPSVSGVPCGGKRERRGVVSRSCCARTTANQTQRIRGP